MINTCFIWCLEKSSILDRNHGGFIAAPWSPRVCTGLEKGLWDNLTIYHYPRLAWNWPQRQTTCFGVGVPHRLSNLCQKLDQTHQQILARRSPIWLCSCCYIFGLKINELPSPVTTDIFRTFFADDLAICLRGVLCGHHGKHIQQT